MKNPQETKLKAMQLSLIAMLGDSVTTDHISPADTIKKDSPAGRF